MKKIGRGWQYTTYDLGNGRVLKKYNSKFIGYVHIFLECFPFNKEPIWKIPRYYRGCKNTALDSIRKISISSIIPEWMMGNPKILNSLDYEQDKLIPIHDYFKNCDLEKGKKVIDLFIEFNKILVENSLIDKSFNVGKNFALDKDGRVVLMDLGELYSSPVSIQKQIKNRAWAKEYVLKPIPKNLRSYFVEKMDIAFNIDEIVSIAK